MGKRGDATFLWRGLWEDEETNTGMQTPMHRVSARTVVPGVYDDLI